MEIEKKEGENGGENVETLESLQAKLAEVEAQKAKAEEERENYKKGLLSREEELKKFKKQDDNDDEGNNDDEEDSQWDDASAKFQSETLSKSEKIAEQAAVKALEKRTETSAQSKFLSSHQDITQEVWEKVVANYSPQNGKDSEENILKDLERAYILYRYDNNLPIGKVDTSKQEGEEKVKQAAITYGAPVVPSEQEDDDNKVTDSQLYIASKMGVSKEALEKEDDSLRAEISIV